MTTLLSTHNLTLEIANTLICRDLNLQIEAGDIWGVLGPNGSGKTTLIHTLGGLQTASTGEILLQGKNLFSLPKKKIAQEIGIVFQETPQLFPQTVLESCLAGRHPHLSSFSWESAEDLNITKTALEKMELSTLLHRPVQTLSGGERRRLAIATLLTQAPKLYLLDEPTNHLDLHHQVKVLTHFKSLTQSTSTAVITSLHDLNFAQQFCNKIIMLLGDGKTLYGKLEDVLTQENVTQLYQHPVEKISYKNSMLWATVIP